MYRKDSDKTQISETVQNGLFSDNDRKGRKTGRKTQKYMVLAEQRKSSSDACNIQSFKVCCKFLIVILSWIKTVEKYMDT